MSRGKAIPLNPGDKREFISSGEEAEVIECVGREITISYRGHRITYDKSYFLKCTIPCNSK